MKLTVHVEGTPTEIAAELTHVAATLTHSAMPAKTLAKAAKAVAQVEESFDLGDDDAPPADEPEAPKPPTLENVIDGFKAYVAKHDREKAAKVLGKFKVKSVRELKQEQYADVLALIK